MNHKQNNALGWENHPVVLVMGRFYFAKQNKIQCASSLDVRKSHRTSLSPSIKGAHLSDDERLVITILTF